MRSKVDEVLFNFLLTQKSVHQKTAYDVIEDVIHQSIEYVKENFINARIANLALNINGKLVLAQVYVERKNGFAPTAEKKQYGTTPTAYNVQVRFPFGLETKLENDTIILPSTDFKKPLEAYYSASSKGKKVSDDVKRDYDSKDIICGPGVQLIKHQDSTYTLKCVPEGQTVKFKVGMDLGKGYVNLAYGVIEYDDLNDYNLRLKAAGVYPLFYSSSSKEQCGLLVRHAYRGYTNLQEGIHESKRDGQVNAARIEYYENYLKEVNKQLLNSDAGQYWQQCLGKQEKKSDYLFNISIINGTTLYADSGLPVTRLRDYQLELFNNCQAFIEAAATKNNNKSGSKQAGKIAMGVGAGKTFFTFTLLQHLKQEMQKNPNKLGPSFCLAPDEAVAEVTKKSIDRQGVMTGITAAAISKAEQMPDKYFMQMYQQMSEKAALEAKQIDEYIDHGLQDDILKFCLEKNLHPNKLINLLYTKSQFKYKQFKESIEIKRLLLLAEGQKSIKNKSGMLGITALKNLLEQFTTLKETIDAEIKNASAQMGTRREQDTIFADFNKGSSESALFKINYNQDLSLPRSMEGAIEGNQINLTQLTKDEFISLLKTKHKNNRRAMRDDLMSIAFLSNKEAAILMANSGGLGNTSTPDEIEKQIKRFEIDAFSQFQTLVRKQQLTLAEHYRLYTYLNSLFSTIPDAVHFNVQVPENMRGSSEYLRSLNDNFLLIDHINDLLNSKLSAVTKVKNLKLSQETLMILEKHKIQDSNIIDATNQLAGIASMQLTGTCKANNAKLLLTHIPVFTPEGIACYFEHLAGLENQPSINFVEENGIYIGQFSGQITKNDIEARLRQILNAIMVADEIHKDEFKFLYDTDNPIYQRINAVTQQYMKEEFVAVLPHRIGMSGTINEVAEKAFGTTTIYSLSTQKMMQQGLMKQVGIDSHIVSDSSTDELAKQIVIDYFAQSSDLSLINVMSKQNCAVDLFTLSKGIIFSKTENQALNDAIIRNFNLLKNINPNGLQEELFNKINEKRNLRIIDLQNKLVGKTELCPDEIVQINLYNCSQQEKISIENKRISNALGKVIHTEELNLNSLEKIQRQALYNNLFAVYIEYILSKSTAPKEFSDIIGLQNKLFEKGVHLIDMVRMKGEIEVDTYLSLMKSIDAKSITQADVVQFINERIKDTQLQNNLIKSISQHKNDYQKFLNSLCSFADKIELGSALTTERNQFESGLSLALLGSTRERTGYSHEPTGIIIDAPGNIENHNKINFFLRKQLEQNEIQPFLESLQTLVHDCFSYDEKNQAGGRALRTPYGHVRYVEYLTELNNFIARFESNPALRAFKIETQFQAIFTADESLAQEERESISFNRETLLMLKQDFISIKHLEEAIRKRFAEKFADPFSAQQLNQYIKERLPLLWSMKYETELAHCYLSKPNDALFNELRNQLSQPIEFNQFSIKSTKSRKPKIEYNERSNLIPQSEPNSSIVVELKEQEQQSTQTQNSSAHPGTNRATLFSAQPQKDESWEVPTWFYYVFVPGWPIFLLYHLIKFIADNCCCTTVDEESNLSYRA